MGCKKFCNFVFVPVVHLQKLTLNLQKLTLYHVGNSTDVCSTKSCVLAAASLLDSIDETVSPCEDFFSFVCGNYIDKVIRRRTIVPVVNDIRRKLSRFLQNDETFVLRDARTCRKKQSSEISPSKNIL